MSATSDEAVIEVGVEKQQRVRSMRTQLRRLRNQRGSIMATQGRLLPKIV